MPWSRLTLEEKVKLTHAQSKFEQCGCAPSGHSRCMDGRRPPRHTSRCVVGRVGTSRMHQRLLRGAFPALTCLAVTWNPEMSPPLRDRASVKRRATRNKSVLLGPVSISTAHRSTDATSSTWAKTLIWPERWSSPYIRGVQQNGVAACVKHFALNNHEVDRHTTNVIVDDRALYEIYLPAFKMAVQEGGAWSIMGAYNLYKGQHLCHNQYTLNDILKGEWGFRRRSHFRLGRHSTIPGKPSPTGLDMEFGSWTNRLSNGASNTYDNYYLANPYLNLIPRR